MSNRPGRPRGGPGLPARAAEYKRLRERELSYEAAAEVMGVSRDAVRWYAKHLRNAGELPPLKRATPKPPAPPRPPSRCRAAVLAHLRRWPDSLFSSWDLRRVVGSSVERVLSQLADEGLVEVVDGRRYPSDQRVPARRYRLAASAIEERDRLSSTPAVQDATEVPNV